MATKTTNTSDAIVVKNLQKSFKNVEVLLGINFTVKRGTILALLGPNGAGKTTTIRILSTLLYPDGGRASINGFDVVKQAAKARNSLGLTGQFAAVDEYLTGRENLLMIGRLYRLSQADTVRRTDELLGQFDLQDAAGRAVRTYSGGMKRRLDLAMSLIASPPILFLDEPTTGLDPRSRLTMWDMIKQLVNSGTTILLTTQYMEEADRLADNIVVIDNGKVIAEGTSDSLKNRIGSEFVDLTVASDPDFAKAARVLSQDHPQSDPEKKTLSLPIEGGAKKLKAILQTLEDNQIEVTNVNLRRPTLDDVFLSLTGHEATHPSKEAKS